MADKKTEDLILEARGFFDSYKKEIGKSAREGKNIITLDFNDLAQFSHQLTDLLVSLPEEIFQVLEVALEESGLVTNPRIRLLSLPDAYSEKIRNLRAKHLNKLIQIEGLVRQASEVRPQVINAKFECPSCGTILSVLQIESRFREPSRCSCGRKGGFKLVSKDMVDAQRIVIEESPESLSGGEQPRRISVFLKEDLVEPKMEEKTTPGSKVRIIGILKEIPRLSQSGGILTRYDIALEANNIIPLEETFEELNISEEDERQIKELAADPKVLEKFIESIAPSIYGYEEVKKALVLQLFGGIKKVKGDGTQTRGDTHVLLVGDPGVAKSQLLKFISSIAPKGRYVAGRGTSISYNEPLLIKENSKQKFVKIGEFVDRFYEDNETGFVMCNNGIEALSLNLNTLKLEWKPIKAVYRHEINENLLAFQLETGRKIKVTKDHSIFCIENGEIRCKPSKELKLGDYVIIPKFIPSNEFDLAEDIAKFLGYFIAEGHLYNKEGSYKIQFTLNKNENSISSEIKVIAEKYLQKECSIKQHGKNAIRLTIYGKEPYMKVCSWLGSLAHKTAREKGVPEIILNSNHKARQAFFESYIKGDAGVTKSERLMSEILYMQLQDKIIASCVEAKMNKTSIIESRTILDTGSRFDLKSPKINRRFLNLRINFPIACLPENLKIFFKKKMKSGYSRINLERIDNSMLFERLMRVFREEKISEKRIRELFGENSIEYFTMHQNLFLKEKAGREIEIALTLKGIETVKDILKLRKLLESDVSFVKIKKIEEVKQEDKFVYDISTPENENFVAGFGGIVCHNTGAGLTATVVRDEFLRGWSLEAGAMVLSNKGIVCIDEIEKMDEQERSAMHEALEQQTVTISKANVQACYSEDTEVLTETGWKKYSEVKEEKIAQYNPKDKTIQFLPHKGLYIYDYNSKMYHFKNGKNDILVTPNHKMLAREFSQKSLKEIEAKDLKYDYIKFVNSGEYIGQEQEYFILPAIKHKQNRKHPKYVHQHIDKKISIDLWLEFLGYYLTEGGIETAPTIGIVQRKGENAEKIKRCLTKLTSIMGCSLSEIDCGRYVRYKITQTQLYEYLKNLGEKCHLKKSNLNFSLLSKRQLKILFDAMMLGDGSSDKKYFSVTSKELSDGLQIIAHLIGKSASQHIHYLEGSRKNRRTMFRVSISNETEPSIRKKDIKIVDYNGKVFCFSTETGFFITRRNGKIAIQGNTLRAETSVLAAANPKFGRFDPYQTVASQIDIPPTLINRFDVIFVLKDIPERARDEAIATHVLLEHQKPELKSPIERDLFRKYIAYSKQKIFPKLTDEVIQEIKKFYVDLRNMPQSIDQPTKPLPISARQLEALIRLSEASAKLRLSKKVLKQDAKVAIDLMKYYLMQVGYDYETKTFDIDRIATGMSTSQRGKILMVRETLARLESRLGKLIPIEEIMKELEGKLAGKDIDESLDKLTISGDIFHPRKGFVQRM